MNPELEGQSIALQSPDASLRATAAQALGRLGDPKAVPYLLEMLDDPDQRVRQCVADALGRIVAQSHPEFHAALNDADAFARESAPQTIHMVVPSFTSVLLQTLRTADGFILDSAIEALGRVGPAVVPDLLEILQDQDGFVRAAAAEALGRIADPAAIPALLKLLQDPNSFTWQCAADALVCYGRRIVPALLEALRDKRSQRGAATVLGKLGDASVTPALLQAIQSADMDFAFDCHLAFERIGPAARPYILEALRDPYEFSRASAATALGVVGDGSDVPALLEVLQDTGRFGRARACAADALGNIKDPSAIPALIEALDDRHESVRAGAVAALGAFGKAESVRQVIQALGDPALSVRQKAVDVLSDWDSAAIPDLEQALLQPNETICVGAATALLRICEDKELPRRIMSLPNIMPAKKAAALSALEKAHYPMFAPGVLCQALMGDQNPTVRQAAVDILRILEPTEAFLKPHDGTRLWQRKFK